MTFDEIQIGDKLARMIRGKPLLTGTVVGKDEHGLKNKGGHVILAIGGGGEPVTVLKSELEEWTVLRG